MPRVLTPRELGKLVLRDRRLHLPAALEPVLRRVLSGPPVTVADLGDQLDGGSRLVFARRLVREGVLLVDDPDS